MKLSKLIPATLSVLTAVTLTGCFPTGEVSDPAPSQTAPATSTAPTSGDASVPSDTSAPANTVLTVGDKVTIDVTPPASYPSEVPIIKCHLRDFRAESEEIKKFFIDGKEIYKEDSHEDSISYFTADGGFLNLQDQGVLSYTPEDHIYDGENEKRDIYKMQRTCADNIVNSYFYFPHMNDELEGFPRSEALARANELIEQLDVKYLGEPQIYAITAEDARGYGKPVEINKEENEESTDDQIVLNKEDELYLVLYQTVYDDVAITSDSAKIHSDNYTQASWARVLLTKDEMVLCEFFHVFDSIEESEEVQVKCSPETAVSKMYDYYTMQEYSLVNTYEFTDSMNLVYATWISDDLEKNVLSYKVAWAIPGYVQLSDENVKRILYIYIDVLTGMISKPTI